MNRNGPELEQVVHTVQQIVPERLAEEGLVLKILVQRFVFAHFLNMAASKAFSWTDDERDLLLRCELAYKSNYARKNLLLLVLFVISFNISKSCIVCRRLFPVI